MCSVFGHTETLLLTSYSAALKTFLCNPECVLFEKLKLETRVRISPKNTDTGVDYVCSGRFEDIIRANQIIHSFTQQLSGNVIDSLSDFSTLVSDSNEKQKLFLVHCEDDESDLGINSNCQIEKTSQSGIDSSIPGCEISKCCTNQRVTKDKITEKTCNKDHIIALKDPETNIFSDFVSSTENERIANKEANASTSVLSEHDIKKNNILKNVQNAKIKDDFEPTDMTDEKVLNNSSDLLSDDDHKSNVESSGKEIILGPDKYNQNENNNPFTITKNMEEEKSLLKPGENKKRKRKNHKTRKVINVHHPDVDLDALPEESSFKYEETVFSLKKNAGKLVRDKENPKLAKSECGFCPYVNFLPYARSKRQLMQHFARNHAKTDPVHKCELCSRSFCTKQHLYNHKRQKHIFKKCETCEKVVLKNYYHMHIKLHQHDQDGNVIRKFECDICKKKLSSKHTLQQHLKRVHSSVEERELFTCETCKKSWLEKKTLDRHMKVKHGNGAVKEHLCDICGKGFETPYDVKKHKQVHDKVPQHVCDVCSKAFKFREGLLIHMRTHSGERNYLCKDCGKTFQQSGALKRHQRTHTGERPFVCSLCKDTFNDTSILRRHMILKHKKEK
ncbi:Zinc finger and BTB domain-containing protein 49 [Mytilus edulis]|uniref:Zinc finger and BTB domain-containing protein 49 n=1 Tax=Mytilus edulis TaxID=6550 RepID=A0A8S3U4M1_MYTED|nr:Zinc finger and BTB domain-containing protein 49 [Mytilus edulis]